MGDRPLVNQLLAVGCPLLIESSGQELYSSIPEGYLHLDWGPGRREWISASDLAAKHGHLEIVKDLLVYTATVEPDRRCYESGLFSAIQEAAMNDRHVVVIALLDFGATSFDQDDLMNDCFTDNGTPKPVP